MSKAQNLSLNYESSNLYRRRILETKQEPEREKLLELDHFIESFSFETNKNTKQITSNDTDFASTLSAGSAQYVSLLTSGTYEHTNHNIRSKNVLRYTKSLHNLHIKIK